MILDNNFIKMDNSNSSKTGTKDLKKLETMNTWRDVVTIMQTIPNYKQKFAGLTWHHAKDEWEDTWTKYRN